MSGDDKDDFLSQMATSTDEGDDTEAGEKSETEEAGEGEGGKTGDPANPPEKKDTAAPPAPDPDKKTSEHVPLAALKAEREKRQELERQLAELRNPNPQQPGQAKTTDTPQQPPASFYDDPEAYVRNQITQVQRQADGRLFAALEADAREQFPDFDEVMEGMVDKVKDNPALREQIFRSANPARAAYRLGKQLKDAEALQKDPEAERERIRAEERTKLEAEFKAKDEARRKAADAIPPDLAATRSTTGASTPADGGVFNELFKDT